jgi:hypothetical protein
MDALDRSNSGPPAANPRQTADHVRRSPEATACAPTGHCFDDTTFHELNNAGGDGKSRRAAPWPFLIRRLG